MPRALRIEYSGAIYHVMNRGNHDGVVFRDDRDREIFLETLGEACEASGWVVHGFCLMGNHYHLVLETQRPTLSKGMQWLNSTYTLRFNGRHKLKGHLFQGRYKAVLVDGQEPGYFGVVVDYVHMNPVRAGRAKTLRELLSDKWSSAGWLAGWRGGRPAWLEWRRVYGAHNLRSWGPASWRCYRKNLARRVQEEILIKKGRKEDPYGAIRRGWSFGAEEFVRDLKGRFLEKAGEPDEGRGERQGGVEAEVEEDRARGMLAKAARKLGSGRIGDLGGDQRFLAGLWVRQQCRVSARWLAGQLGLESFRGVSSSLSRVRKRMETDRKLKSQWNKLLT